MWHVWLVLSASPLSDSTSQCLSTHQSLIPDLQSSSLWLPPYSSPATHEEAHYWQSTSSAEHPSDSSLHQQTTERERDRVNELKDAANERISYIYCVCPLSPKEARFHLILCVVTHKAASFSEPVVLNWWIVTQNWVCKLHRKTNAKWK